MNFQPPDWTTLAHPRGRLLFSAMGRLWLGSLGVVAATAQAQTSPPLPLSAPGAASAPSAEPTQRVEVSGAADDRRNASVSKFVLTGEDIRRYGDTTLADVLRRVPGVSVGNTSGRANEIRLRGMGNGYTQVLVNGEPVPPGFSMDSISPNLIERIEVQRSATADQSTQAIAGTLAITLRRSLPAGQTELKAGAARADGRPSAGNLSSQIGGRDGKLSWTLGAQLGREENRWPSQTEVAAQDDSGTSLYARRIDTNERQTMWTLALTPRLHWTTDEQRSLTLDGLLQRQHGSYSGQESRTVLSGEPPDFGHSLLTADTHWTQARSSLNWKTQVGADGRLNLKASAALYRRRSSSVMDADDPAGEWIYLSAVESKMEDSSLTLTGKYALGLGDAHSLGLGWDGQHGHRSENRLQDESSSGNYPALDVDESYSALVSRLALYAQDEWTLRPGASAYAGLRWEGLQTRTSGNVLDAVKHRSSVFSPTVQLLWKIPDTRGDQLRLSLARTYKAPTARELIPRRWVTADNSATKPNYQGNPDLLPELAWGLDLGYERYLSGDGFIGANVYGRRIAQVVTQRIYEDNGTWITSPYNHGGARVLGLELEAKAKLRSLLGADSADMDLRSGLTRNWSRVDQVPGPGNSVNQQAPLTLNLGADWRLASAPLTLGASYGFEKRGSVRLSELHHVSGNPKRTLDAYGLWKVNPSTRLRLTLANLLAPTDTVNTLYHDDSLSQQQQISTRSFPSLRLGLELNL